MVNRYKNRLILKNDMEQYENIFRERNVKYIYQYTSPNFTYVNASQYPNLNIISYTWKVGDRYYKLAEKYYGDATSWWVIAKFNLRPTESHLRIGDILYIPTPIDRVLNYMRG